MRSGLAALLVVALLALGAAVLVASTQRQEGGRLSLLDDGPASFNATVLSFDATPIEITVYRPERASAGSPVPIVLHSHGWAGSRTTDGAGIVGALWGAGLGVVSIDARGHGASGGFATLHHRDVEVRDFQRVLDWAYDELDWAMREPGSGVEKDLVVGAAGYSYGGGFQLMTASHDARLDAIAPEITWTDLATALAPNGVPKSLWLDFLVADARASGTRVDPRVEAWYRSAVEENALPPDAFEHLAGSSPRLDAIDADVLLVQGIPDTLFPLNEALRAFEALDARGIDVRLLTHLTGHVAPHAQPFGTSAERRDIFQDGGPCGSTSATVVAWLREKLAAGAASGIPRVSYALEDGACVELDALPAARLAATAALAVAPSGAGSLTVPLELPDRAIVVAGAPILRAQVDGTGLAGIGVASLVVVGADGFARVVDDQSMPFRAEPGRALEVELAGVATRIAAGDRLLLRLDGLNEWYAHNGERAIGASVLRDITVTLPVVE